MKLKKNKSGKLQYYDSKGRYAKTPSLSNNDVALSKNDIKRQRNENKHQTLIQKANVAGRRNPLLNEVFNSIERAFPGEILDVETDMDSKYTSIVRNLDIVGKNFIIEVKSGKSKGKDRQLYAQFLYSKKAGKTAIVFAPNIDPNSEERYKRKGIIIFTRMKDMIKYMREKIK